MNLDDELLINKTKKLIIRTAMDCKSNHIPSSLSCLEILYTLYTKITNINIKNMKDLIRDRIILSKEHARLGQVCLLTQLGLLPENINKEWQQNGGRVGHDMFNGLGINEISAIDISFGTLGMGIGLAAGMAWAKPNSHIYVIVGDGELQEGSMWEAIMFIGHHQLKNVTIVVDRNYLQISDYTKNIIDSSSNVINQIESFNFDCIECNGHDIYDIEKAFKAQTQKPKCIVANTIKGKECMFVVENHDTGYLHGSPFSDEEIEIMLRNVGE
ncbi:MAG: thiamine pyrophosphate-dependent enzyme [Candidatus Gastranaerophilaceae bacterium]